MAESKDEGGQVERDRTDASLEAERDKTDQELEGRAVAIEDGADAQIARARERATLVLAQARARADDVLAASGSSAAARVAVAAERRSEDAAVAEETSVADAELLAERELRRAAITQLLELERAETDSTLLAERERADRAIGARDDFLGMVSHDLRTMLGGITMAAAMIVRDAGDDEPGRRTVRRADAVARYATRMNRLIGDLVDVVSIEAGKLDVVPVARDATRLIRDTLEMFQPVAAARGVALHGEVGRETLLGTFDHDRVLQVLGNLVSNAVRFVTAGGDVWIRAVRVGDAVQFSVRDTGAGIAAEQLEAIFERFHQAKRTDRSGLGLGLYIARCIIEAHGGRIWAESVPGAGSTFHFTLPAAA